MEEYWDFNSETFWMETASKNYENDPTLDNWDKFIQEVDALKQRRLWEIADAQEHLERLERLVPDMLHKAKNRESYNQSRSR